MADTKDYVVRLRVDGAGAKTELQSFTVKGDEAASSMKRVGKAFEDTQAKTDPVFKALLTQQREVEKATKIAADAVKYYGVSQDQANATVRRATDYYGALVTKAKEGAAAQSTLGKAMSGVQGQMVALAGGAGAVGTFLSGLGPWGMAAAAGLSLVSAAFAEVKRTSEVLTKEADALTNMSEVTGFATSTLQAITMEAAKHGVSMEQASAAVVKFTSSWADAREGGGDMLKKLREIDPALAAQMQITKDSATAFDILTRAIAQADKAGDIATRNALARAAGGRGGVLAFTGLSSGIGAAGGLDALTKGYRDEGKVIGGDLLNEIDNLKDELDEAKKRADLFMGSIAAKHILESELAFEKLRLKIAQIGVESAEAQKKMSWGEWLGQMFTPPETAAFGRKTATDVKVPIAVDYPPKVTGLDAPVKPQVLDTRAQLANLKEYTSLLGTAATADDRLRLKRLETQAVVEGNATAENKHAAALGLSAAQTDAYIEKLSARVAALGASVAVASLAATKAAALKAANDNRNQEAANDRSQYCRAA